MKQLWVKLDLPETIRLTCSKHEQAWKETRKSETVDCLCEAVKKNLFFFSVSSLPDGDNNNFLSGEVKVTFCFLTLTYGWIFVTNTRSCVQSLVEVKSFKTLDWILSAAVCTCSNRLILSVCEYIQSTWGASPIQTDRGRSGWASERLCGKSLSRPVTHTDGHKHHQNILQSDSCAFL